MNKLEFYITEENANVKNCFSSTVRFCSNCFAYFLMLAKWDTKGWAAFLPTPDVTLPWRRPCPATLPSTARAPNSHPRQAKFSRATHFYLGHHSERSWLFLSNIIIARFVLGWKFEETLKTQIPALFVGLCLRVVRGNVMHKHRIKNQSPLPFFEYIWLNDDMDKGDGSMWSTHANKR